MSLAEKAAYIRGLADGLELEADKKEARVIKEMLDLLGEMAGEVDDIGADLTDLFEVVDEIDENLGFVEGEVFGGDMHHHFEDEMYEITCPFCQATVVVEEDQLLGGEDIVCTACGEKIEIELDACDCGCGHHHD